MHNSQDYYAKFCIIVENHRTPYYDCHTSILDVIDDIIVRKAIENHLPILYKEIKDILRT